jgi:hypothetical protein
MTMNEDVTPQEGEETVTPTASVQDKHDYLVALFKESRYGLVDFGFRQSAVVTLLIGWIVTSKLATEFVRQNRTWVPPIAAAALTLYFCFFVYWTLTYKWRSRFAYERLLDLEYLPTEFYAPLCITNRLVWNFFCMHGVTCATLIAYLFLT